MKKLALLLGALSITATAFAGGKEIVPQGKEVTPVKEVVKEVIVYRNSPAVRSAYPNGSVDMFYRWWGQSNADKHDGFKDYQGNGNRGRLHVQGSINMTEKDNFYFRVRDNQPIGNNKNYTVNDLGEKDYERSKKATQVRLRYSHNHDFLDGIATSRLHYEHYTNSTAEYTGFAPGANNLEYQMRFNFAKYGFDNDFIKSKSLTIAPKVGYSWGDDGDLNKTNTYYGGIDLYTSHTLPWNFSFEFNVYTNFAKSNTKVYDKKYVEDPVTGDVDSYGTSKSGFQAMMEAYLYNTTKLVDLGDSAKLSFYFEGGYDPYKWSNKRHYAQGQYSKSLKKQGDKSDYSLYALPALRLDYQVNENINTFLVAGAEMRNIHTANSEAQGWVWQPTAWAGFKVSF